MLIKSFLTSALLATAASAAPQSTHSIVKRDRVCDNKETRAGQWLLYNNPWGASGARGLQCTTLGSANGDNIKYNSVFSWAAGKGGVKAYPNAKRIHGVTLGNIGSLTSSVTWDLVCAQPNVGASIVYDLFGNYRGQVFEVMLWLGAPGGAYPIGYPYTKRGTPRPNIRGIQFPNDPRKYNLYIGSNGSYRVYSFVIQGTLVESGGRPTKHWVGNLDRFLTYLTTMNLPAYVLGSDATLDSSSFGIESTYGAKCKFSVDLNIHKS